MNLYQTHKRNYIDHMNKWEKKSVRNFSILSGSIHHESMHYDLRRLVGRGYSYRFAIFRPGVGGGYCLASEMQMITDYLARKILRNDKFIKNNLRQFKIRERLLVKVGLTVEKLDVQRLTHKELLAVFEKAVNTYKLFAAYGPISTRILSNALSGGVRRWLKLKLAQSDSVVTDGLLEQLLSQLIVPKGETLAIKEEKELIKLAAIAARTHGLLDLLHRIKRQPGLVAILTSRYPTFAKKLSKHILGYCWLPVFIEGPAWTLQDFLNRLINLAVNKNYLVRQREIKNQVQSIRYQHQKLIKQIKPPLPIRRLLNYLGAYLSLRTQFGYMQGYGNYHLKKFYTEIAQRAGLSLEDFMALTVREIRLFLQTGVLPSRQTVKARCRLAVLIMKNGQESILTNDAAKQYIKRELPRTSTGKQDFVTGLTVYPGRVRGIARVLTTSKEISKVRRGDILVTTMTSPDMVPIFHKIKGIVTNEGALTCHAAIISREMKIPCIISTKNATSIFRDGNRIELIPETGTVKLINK